VPAPVAWVCLTESLRKARATGAALGTTELSLGGV